MDWIRKEDVMKIYIFTVYKRYSCLTAFPSLHDMFLAFNTACKWSFSMQDEGYFAMGGAACCDRQVT
jgi:hypothetical protein